ncbi:hypothetical protein T05_14643 [Trichinella murrelli]|uniref:Uncharacterized protein n=1 Tax=Trichinella murrelli TaxID=144512 RepID=A0A0V0UFR1_9BILA|nr:hypothetical protein T05_14643 [Trichinella murrelli]
MECNRQSHLKSNSANQCAIIRGFALRLTLSWGKQTAPHGIKTSKKMDNYPYEYNCVQIMRSRKFFYKLHMQQNPRAIKFEEDTKFSAMIM